MAASAPSAVILEEQSGDRRRLELRGPGLPFRGAAWPVEQRLVTEYYQGSPEATQHVLGPADMPSDWNGVWNTTRLAFAPCRWSPGGAAAPIDVRSAFDLYRIVDDMVRAGRLLRVTWAADGDRKIVRVGRLREFRPEFDRADDIRWTAKLEWTGRGEPSKRLVTFRGEDVPAAMAAARAALNAVVASIEQARLRRSAAGVPLSASSFTIGDLESMAEGPGRFLDDVTKKANAVSRRVGQVAGLIAKAGQAPAQLAGQAVSVSAGARASTLLLADAASRAPAETLTTSQSVAAQVRVAVYFGAAGRRLEDAAAAASSLERAVRARSSGLDPSARAIDRAGPSDVLAVVVASFGDTFVSLSRRHYGTPDRGAEIARANGLSTYSVRPPPGKALVIPRLGSFASPRAV